MSEVIQDVTRREGSFFVRVAGEIDLRHSPKFHQELIELCAEKPRRMLLNMSQVDYIDSSGIGTLVEIFRRLNSQDGELMLVAPSKRVRDVLDITRLLEFFRILDSEDDLDA
jgi:anti-sigma B factor antagonist